MTPVVYCEERGRPSGNVYRANSKAAKTPRRPLRAANTTELTPDKPDTWLASHIMESTKFVILCGDS
ncbi:hypothetical protein J6590_018919 [Homalodisca vitripennis]|nr:hypothetical protein J6590_018919 [Homalodisca vitripennis]